MISLHSILAAVDIIKHLPMIICIVAGVLLVLAFIMGFVKGFRKVSWDGVAWLAGGLTFVYVGKVVPMPNMWVALFIALASAGASFALFKLLAYFLRPKMRWIDDDINADTSLAEYGLEFEPEYVDYDGEHDYQPYGKRIYKTGYGEPSLFFRVLGGAACAINVGMVLWILFSAFILIVDVSALKGMAIGSILNDETVRFFFPLAKNYFFDYLTIGIMMLMAKAGFNRGLMYTLTSAVITVGAFASLVFSFYLPFSQFATQGFFAKFIETCMNAFVSFGPFGGILGKLLAGLILFSLSIILLVILNIILKNVCRVLDGIGLTRELDCWLAAAVYLVLGLAVCVGAWFILAGIDTLGIFPFTQMLGDRALLTNNIVTYVKAIVDPFLAKAQS